MKPEEYMRRLREVMQKYGMTEKPTQKKKESEDTLKVQ